MRLANCLMMAVAAAPKYPRHSARRSKPSGSSTCSRTSLLATAGVIFVERNARRTRSGETRKAGEKIGPREIKVQAVRGAPERRKQPAAKSPFDHCTATRSRPGIRSTTTALTGSPTSAQARSRAWPSTISCTGPAAGSSASSRMPRPRPRTRLTKPARRLRKQRCGSSSRC